MKGYLEIIKKLLNDKENLTASDVEILEEAMNVIFYNHEMMMLQKIFMDEKKKKEVLKIIDRVIEDMYAYYIDNENIEIVKDMRERIKRGDINSFVWDDSFVQNLLDKCLELIFDKYCSDINKFDNFVVRSLFSIEELHRYNNGDIYFNKDGKKIYVNEERLEFFTKIFLVENIREVLSNVIGMSKRYCESSIEIEDNNNVYFYLDFLKNKIDRVKEYMNNQREIMRLIQENVQISKKKILFGKSKKKAINIELIESLKNKQNELKITLIGNIEECNDEELKLKAFVHVLLMIIDKDISKIDDMKELSPFYFTMNMFGDKNANFARKLNLLFEGNGAYDILTLSKKIDDILDNAGLLRLLAYINNSGKEMLLEYLIPSMKKEILRKQGENKKRLSKIFSVRDTLSKRDDISKLLAGYIEICYKSIDDGQSNFLIILNDMLKVQDNKITPCIAMFVSLIVIECIKNIQSIKSLNNSNINSHEVVEEYYEDFVNDIKHFVLEQDFKKLIRKWNVVK